MYIYIGMGRPPQPQEQPAGHRGDPIQVGSLHLSLSLPFSLPLCPLPLPCLTDIAWNGYTARFVPGAEL